MLKTTMETYISAIEAALKQAFPEETCRQSRIFEACRYSLLAGGKRIRPMLLLEFYRLCGGRIEDAMPFACGLEMIHTYSLIHDDLPCMDDDDYRRGRLSNHKVFGEAMATLAGDALLNRAFETMLSPSGVPAQQALAGAAWISRCSGVYGMIGGQVQDLALEDKTPSAEELHEMVSLKTGALLQAACVGGVLLAGGTQAQRDAAAEYGECVGLAFQIADDILDVEGDSAELGKQTGSDAANHKSTFVTMYGIEACRGKVRDLTFRALKAAEAFEDHAFISELAQYLARRTH